MPSWLEDVEKVLARTPIGRFSPDAPGVRAAVLVPLFVDGGSLWVLLTRRSRAVAHHPGQIVFPGGARDVGDDDEVATALREAREELGIEPGHVMILGHLSDVATSSGYLVSPVVGAIPWPLSLKLTDSEVEEIIRLPLVALSSPDLVEEREIMVAGRPVASPIFHYGKTRIWGATARIVVDLLERLSLASPGGEA